MHNNLSQFIEQIDDKLGSVIATKSELVRNLCHYLLQKGDIFGNVKTYKS